MVLTRYSTPALSSEISMLPLFVNPTPTGLPQLVPLGRSHTVMKSCGLGSRCDVSNQMILYPVGTVRLHEPCSATNNTSRYLRGRLLLPGTNVSPSGAECACITYVGSSVSISQKPARSGYSGPA